MNFSNMTKFCIFAVKSDGSSKISQNVQNLFFFEIKKRRVFWKRIWILSKMAENGKFVSESDASSRISQNVQYIGFFIKVVRFFEKET